MSASLKNPCGGWLWGAAEIARAKQLRREGGTFPAVAVALSAEFNTQRTTESVSKLFAKLRRPAEMRADDAARKAAARRAVRLEAQAAQLVTVKVVRLECLAGGRGHYFDSWSASANRVCDDCKRSGTWW